MSYTDRDLRKQQEAGQLGTMTGVSDALAEVSKIHRRPLNFARTGSETGASNVAESPGGVVKRLSYLKAASLVAKSSVTNNATNYAKVYIYKYNSTAGSKTLLASWNTATAAQSALTAFRNHSLTLTSTTADLSVAADSVITYHVGKFGAGGATLNTFSVTLDFEEI